MKMIDADKIKKYLERCTESSICLSEYEEGQLDAYISMAEYISDLPDCWISVKERLPEDDLPEDSKKSEIRVMVCTAGKKRSTKKVTRTCYAHGANNEKPVHERNWYWSRDVSHVTHWMPLPEAPEREA